MSAAPKSSSRREKLYTLSLTPRFELPKEAWEVVTPILFEGRDYLPPERAYPWFFALDNEDRTGVLLYSEELDCLHEDLEFALIDMQAAHEDMYSDKLMSVDASMYFRRLALIYHADNVDLRIYAYREKVFKLVQHFFGLKGITDDDRLKERVRVALKQHTRGDVVTLLDSLRGNITVHAALERRRLFTHGLKEQDQFRFLTSTVRVDDAAEGLGTIEKAERYMDMDAAYDRRLLEIDQLCELLARFRLNLVQRLTSASSAG
jgi:hypothetical protein